jgi:tRNA modification GTPase
LIARDQKTQPLVTVLTPQGRGAIGVVRVWGRGAVEVVARTFRPARGGGLAASPVGRLRLGRIGAGLGDEVVAVILPGEDPPSVEIQCHGGPAAMGLVVEALGAAGAKQTEPSDWALHQGASRTQAEAIVDLAGAPTLRTAEILLEQTQGALDCELGQVIELIRQRSSSASEHLDHLIKRGQTGIRLLKGWRVVIAGRPNVGKSRLLNALAGYARAIVHSAPGTTRDVVTVATAFEGWPVELIDTAGFRATDDSVERSGIERALRQAERADLILKVLDRSVPLGEDDRQVIAHGGPSLLVASKSDLTAAWEPSHSALAGRPIHVLSAERGEGLDELQRAIVAALVSDPPEPSVGVPFRPSHLKCLERARDALRGGSPDQAIDALKHVGHAPA